MRVTAEDVHRIATGYHPDPARSLSLRAEAYVEPRWSGFEDRAVFSRTWQWLCHVERLAEPGSYVASVVAGIPIVAVRDRTGVLRAFYNVCKHRAHELLSGSGRSNFMVLQILPDGPERTRETWDFYFETTDLTDAELDGLRYIDEVLQQQDIGIVESVQRGMRTPAFEQGRIVYDPAGTGLSEHGVHHFHGLPLEACRSGLTTP